MSKVATYLQEHISGEVSTNAAVLAAMSRDASVLEVVPEMAIYPRVTNDIRKTARFAWQLAEKGHLLSLTVRGHGQDTTGAALGSGVIISTPAHMHSILEFDAKQKLVRLQPGVNARSLSDALLLQGMGIPGMPVSPIYTAGGVTANNSSNPRMATAGFMNDWVHQLEIVLANGEVLQTERISKHELKKRKGLQTFEGEIYRNLDGLIEDNKQLILEHLDPDMCDSSGYSALAKVKRKDGSFDLTPLFVGSQGTLGIISELILKCEFISIHTGVVVAAFPHGEVARDSLDALAQLNPSFLEYYDGQLFEIAAARGKRYAVCQSVEGMPGAVVVIGFTDFSERARRKNIKHALKLLEQTEASVDYADAEEAAPLLAIRDVATFAAAPEKAHTSAPPLVSGAYVPGERFEEFITGIQDIAQKHHTTLPLYRRALQGTVYAQPELSLTKVGDKQKVFKIVEDYSDLVTQLGGCLVADDGEGRVKANAAYKHLEPAIQDLYKQVKAVFDPYDILNPGVKQEFDPRQIAKHIRSDYGVSNADYITGAS
jgi:FAD/FMN-containing dehydrogenase